MSWVLPAESDMSYQTPAFHVWETNGESVTELSANNQQRAATKTSKGICRILTAGKQSPQVHSHVSAGVMSST